MNVVRDAARAVPGALVGRVGASVAGSARRRDARVLELFVVDVVADLEVGREPAVEEDPEADADIEVELLLEGEVAVVGVDDGDGARVDEPDASDEIGVVVEDELAEPRELSVDRDVREVEVRPLAVLVERRRDAGGAADFEVEARILIQPTIEISVETDRQDVGDIEVDVEPGARVTDELVVQREAPVGLELQAVIPQCVDLLDRRRPRRRPSCWPPCRCRSPSGRPWDRCRRCRRSWRQGLRRPGPPHPAPGPGSRRSLRPRWTRPPCPLRGPQVLPGCRARCRSSRGPGLAQRASSRQLSARGRLAAAASAPLRWVATSEPASSRPLPRIRCDARTTCLGKVSGYVFRVAILGSRALGSAALPRTFASAPYAALGSR